MGWQDFVGKAMTRVEIAQQIANLTWTPKVWCPANPQMPSGIVLHNTAAPTLAQWAETGPSHDARIRNLKSYYRDDQHWNGGPHWFVSRDWINEFDGPLERGTHSPSFNESHFGIEMVGDYSVEPFSYGDGARVRDNSVFLMAILCRKFGWEPGKAIKLHKEDPKTTHDCPGKNVVKSDVITRVRAEIGRLGGTFKPLPPGLPSGFQEIARIRPVRQRNIIATVFGGENDPQLSAYNGRLIDSKTIGVALPCRLVGNLPKVRVLNVLSPSASVVADIVDVGPWNTLDPYWETGRRPQAESGTDMRGRTTNMAGIDLTPMLARAIGIEGKGVVDWEFARF